MPRCIKRIQLTGNDWLLELNQWKHQELSLKFLLWWIFLIWMEDSKRYIKILLWNPIHFHFLSHLLCQFEFHLHCILENEISIFFNAFKNSGNENSPNYGPNSPQWIMYFINLHGYRIGCIKYCSSYKLCKLFWPP